MSQPRYSLNEPTQKPSPWRVTVYMPSPRGITPVVGVAQPASMARGSNSVMPSFIFFSQVICGILSDPQLKTPSRGGCLGCLLGGKSLNFRLQKTTREERGLGEPGLFLGLGRATQQRLLRLVQAGRVVAPDTSAHYRRYGSPSSVCADNRHCGWQSAARFRRTA